LKYALALSKFKQFITFKKILLNSVEVVKMLKSETQLPAIIESDNTTCVEVISLDQKLSTAFCKICYSGGSCEQLIHPCFCKGISICISFVTKLISRIFIIIIVDINMVFEI